MVKTILCLCRDVTLEDVQRAARLGFDHVETVKRFTGALTGPCQGKACRDAVLAALAAATGADPSTLEPPAARPPSFPVRLGLLAGGPPADS